MKRIIYYFKKDIVLTVSWVLAAASAFLVRPDKGYVGYIDWRSLGILWSLMIITKGYMNNGIFEKIGHALLVRTRKMWQLVSVLVALCFFSSMLITNDVSLITFVPFTIMMLKQCGRRELMIPGSITDDSRESWKHAYTDWQSAESVSIRTCGGGSRSVHNVASAIYNCFGSASYYFNNAFKE